MGRNSEKANELRVVVLKLFSRRAPLHYEKLLRIPKSVGDMDAIDICHITS